MTNYDYDKTQELCILKFREDLQASDMSDKSFRTIADVDRIDVGLPEQHYTFTLIFDNTLSGADETILDGLVDGAIGYRVINVSRRNIFQSMIDNASGAPQKARIMDFLDQHGGSFTILLKLNKYSEARGRADVAETATEVVTRLPESGLKIAKGIEKGANKALEKIEDAFNDE